MRPKALWVIIAFLIWGAGSTYWYVCQIKGFCNPTEVKRETTPIASQPQQENTEKKSGVKKLLQDLLSFKWSDDQPVIRDDKEWTAEVKSLSQLKAEGKKLRIEGLYYAEEKNTTSFKNLGLARAHEIKKLLASQIDTGQIITASRLLTLKDSVYPEFVNGYKGYLKWVVDNDFVKEQFDKTLIYFPNNSDKEIRNKKIIDYLNSLVTKLKQDKTAKVSIVGYTDNVGNPDSNKVLGMKRAERIKNLLIQKGISSDRILVSSEGENNPIADNATAQGRQQNRRVEISIIK